MASRLQYSKVWACFKKQFNRTLIHHTLLSRHISWIDESTNFPTVDINNKSTKQGPLPPVNHLISQLWFLPHIHLVPHRVNPMDNLRVYPLPPLPQTRHVNRVCSQRRGILCSLQVPLPCNPPVSHLVCHYLHQQAIHARQPSVQPSGIPSSKPSVALLIIPLLSLLLSRRILRPLNLTENPPVSPLLSLIVRQQHNWVANLHDNPIPTPSTQPSRQPRSQSTFQPTRQSTAPPTSARPSKLPILDRLSDSCFFIAAQFRSNFSIVISHPCYLPLVTLIYSHHNPNSSTIPATNTQQNDCPNQH